MTGLAISSAIVLGCILIADAISGVGRRIAEALRETAKDKISLSGPDNGPLNIYLKPAPPLPISVKDGD